MKYSLISILMFISLVVSSQANDSINNDSIAKDSIVYNRVYEADFYGNEYLIGYCTYDGLISFEGFFKYYIYYFENFTPKLDSLDKYHELIQRMKIKIILGTWCSDSQEQLAYFFRIMEDLGYPPHLYEIIAVDKNKQTEDVDISDLEIKKVPTIIFYYEGKEVGKIIETPNDTMEEDIRKILEKIDYE